MLPKKEILITFSELMKRLFQRSLMNNKESSSLASNLTCDERRDRFLY